MVKGWLSFWQIHILLTNISSVILHSLSRNCFAIKNQVFHFYFKKFRNLHNYNRNKHIKEHNKTILRYNKIVQIPSYCQKEKKQFSTTNILI